MQFQVQVHEEFEANKQTSNEYIPSYSWLEVGGGKKPTGAFGEVFEVTCVKSIQNSS